MTKTHIVTIQHNGFTYYLRKISVITDLYSTVDDLVSTMTASDLIRNNDNMTEAYVFTSNICDAELFPAYCLSMRAVTVDYFDTNLDFQVNLRFAQSAQNTLLETYGGK